MVQDRREPTFSAIAPEKDEVATHQQRAPNRPSGASRSSGGRPAPKKSSPMGGIAFFVALIAVAGAGLLGWQLLETQKNFDDATKRIVALETQLDLNNNNNSQSVDKIFERLDNADSEIRKLWGVSYDTNRKAIATNKDTITAVSGRLNDANTAAKNAKESVDALGAQINEQQLVVNRVREDLVLQEQQVKQVNDLAKRVENLTKQLETRLGTSEEAIEAINAFRRSANSDIQQLKQQIGGQAGPG